MARIGFVLHDAEPEALAGAIKLCEELHRDNHTLVVAGGDRDIPHLTAVDDAEFATGLDLAVSMGGDGTILRTTRLLNGAPVDILGVNFGDLGYLTVSDRHELRSAVVRVLDGDCAIEERMMVEGVLNGESIHALNEIVVERAPGDTTVTVNVSIDGQPFTAYPTDGLIVATPTGSTAYAMSVRGPIVAPTHSCLQLTPVSPHMLFDRTLILGPESTLDLTLSHHRPAVVSVDGRTMLHMEPGDTLHCRRSPRVTRLVAFGQRDHLAVLKSKFGIADR